MPYRDVRRGDVVVFKFPRDPERDFIKRAVGVAGDTLECRAKQLTINGTHEVNPHVMHKDPTTYPESPLVSCEGCLRDNFGPVKVPEGAVFCMGDNRDNSLDSRFWGPVPRSYFKGRALLIYWSYEAEPNSHVWRGMWARVKQLGSVVVNFIPKTRWRRLLSVVR